MILLIDNYDSFVHNLARYLRRLGHETVVVRNDKITVREIREHRPQAIVMSPGPCGPKEAGCCLEVVRELHDKVPLLGVCLGHQVIAEAFGGRVIQASEPVHGRASLLTHDDTGTFEGLPNPFLVGRYHSLVANRDDLPECLRVNAQLTDGTIMAFEHRDLPIVGWQFHPESVLTQNGYQLLSSFLLCAGISGHDESAMPDNELRRAIPTQPDWFERAIEYPNA